MAVVQLKIWHKNLIYKKPDMNSGVSFVRRMNDGPRAEVLEDVWFVFVHVHVFRRIIWGKMYELHDSLPFRCDCTQLSSLPWPLPHIDSNLLSYALIDRGRVKRRGWFCITYYYACFGTGFSYLIYPVLLCGNMGGGGYVSISLLHQLRRIRKVVAHEEKEVETKCDDHQ